MIYGFRSNTRNGFSVLSNRKYVIITTLATLEVCVIIYYKLIIQMPFMKYYNI